MITPARRFFSVLLACAASTAAAQVTVLPDHPTSVTGSCADYQSFLAATGATEPGGATHPGACQFTTFLPTFAGTPWEKYLAEVRAWRKEAGRLHYGNPGDPSWPVAGSLRRPYTISGDTGLTGGPGGPAEMCANLAVVPKFSATIQSSRLDWTGVLTSVPACSREWNRVNPAIALAGRARTTANDIVQTTATSLNGSLAGRFCGLDRAAVESKIAAAVEAQVHGAAQASIARWDAQRVSFDGPGTGASNVCTIRCGECLQIINRGK